MNAEAIVCVVADRLREIIADCPRCAGGGQVARIYVAYRMTNPLALDRFPPPHIEVDGTGNAKVREPCLSCWRLRQVVELAEDYP